MGVIFGRKQEGIQDKNKQQNKIQQVDIIKSKLKFGKEKINNFVKSKKKDIKDIDEQIRYKLLQYQVKKNKKFLIPLLKTKKDLETLVDNGQVRIKLLNDKLAQVQMNQLNIQTVNALQDSNKYINTIQKELQQRDWKAILQQSKNKYDEIQWQEDMQNDETFKNLWKEVGGDKIQKRIQSKNIKVQIKEVKNDLDQKQVIYN